MANPTYAFTFDASRHDAGSKSIFGLSLPPNGGVDDGERLIAYLSAHPKTAEFISTKIVRRFVSDDPPTSLVARVVETFTKTAGNIRDVMDTVLQSSEFWAAAGTKTKSPLEYAVSAIRAAGGEISGDTGVSDFTRRAGMELYGCKPPTGYSNDSRAWINVSAQVARFDFAIKLAANQIAGVRVPADATSREAVLREFESDVLGRSISASTSTAINQLSIAAAVPIELRTRALLLSSADFQVK
jgi:uncharacterized protein (DUF1800 family)